MSPKQIGSSAHRRVNIADAGLVGGRLPGEDTDVPNLRLGLRQDVDPDALEVPEDREVVVARRENARRVVQDLFRPLKGPKSSRHFVDPSGAHSPL